MKDEVYRIKVFTPSFLDLLGSGGLAVKIEK